MDQLSKFFHSHICQKLCNKLITRNENCVKKVSLLTIASCIIAGKLLEISCLKALVVAVHCPHHSWPRLLEHLHTHTPNQHIYN